ncbi:MAG: nitrate- and nitrite sensing domain-containing protein, partial [Gammaproteobacteria bacterium]|nr:nitrate- and nitrite sensing domain-containing protein [Gammaproteobacteria bacterium]
MQQSDNKFLSGSRYWRLICDLRIRQLLLLVFGLLSLISISAITWNAIQVFNQYNEAEQMSGSNAVGQQALALNARLARERGLTAALLSSLDINTAETRQRLSRLRDEADHDLQLLHQLLEQHHKLPTIPIIYNSLETMLQQLTELRHRVDHSLETQQTAISD